MYGGRVSLLDSLIVAGQTAWSNGVGASVGMEAGYAQFGAGVASWLGRSFRVRRSDLRVLVGCGTAAAIGGAFNAPLCGAFYGIELIIGVYSIATLPFVVVAALAGTLTVQILAGGTPPLQVTLPAVVPNGAYATVLVEGMVCGLAGIAIMRGVTMIEAAFRRSGIPVWARPALGGVVVGLLGCLTPAAMSSGHSALHADINVSYPFLVVLSFMLFKAIASAFSIGAGFRGGLFFASLFLGALFGKVFAGVMGVLPFITPMPSGFYAVVGMSGLAVAIVGGPMTMTFLALGEHAEFRRDDGGAGRLDRRRDHRAAAVRLFLRDLAVPSAGRADPLGGGCGLDPFAHRGADDAPARRHGAEGHDTGCVPPGNSARRGAARGGDG